MSVENESITFLLNAVAIVPLTNILAKTTEDVAVDYGAAVGALMNISLGDLIEVVILLMLHEGHLDLILLSLVGSVIVNLLFILGMAVLVGGLMDGEYFPDGANASMLMLVLVMAGGIAGILLPTLTGAIWPEPIVSTKVVAVSGRTMAFVLLGSYGFFIYQQIRARVLSEGKRVLPMLDPEHDRLLPSPLEMAPALMVEQHDEAKGSVAPREKSLLGDTRQMSKLASVLMLTLSASRAWFAADYMVSAIEPTLEHAPLTKCFLGLILLPFLGNASELGTAVAFAMRDNINLAVHVTMGSAIQVVFLMGPVMVLLSWVVGTELLLSFDAFETSSLAASLVVATVVLLSGGGHRSLGIMLCICYGIISVFAFFRTTA